MRAALAVLALAVALLAGAVVVPAQTEPAALTDATVVERDGAVEVWVRLTGPARHQAEVMDGPHRLVIDFEDTAYRWSKGAVAVAQDPLRELRGSQFRKGVARLVIELRRKTPYTLERDREGLRIVFPREAPAKAGPPNAAPPNAGPPKAGTAKPVSPAHVATPTAPPRPAATGPLLYGIVMLDQEAHAYIFDPTLRQVRRYAVGDTVGDAVIETIGERHVVLRNAGGRRELRVDDDKPDRAPARR